MVFLEIQWNFDFYITSYLILFKKSNIFLNFVFRLRLIHLFLLYCYSHERRV